MSMPPVGFEPTISAGERLQKNAVQPLGQALVVVGPLIFQYNTS